MSQVSYIQTIRCTPIFLPNLGGKYVYSLKNTVVTYKGASTRLLSDFSTETFQARRSWHEIFKVMKSKDLQPRLLYPARLSFKIKGDIRSFSDKKKLKEFVNTK